MSGELRLVIGTYERAGGEGLYPLTRSPKGEWRVGEPWPGARNASFGVRSPRSGLHYLVDEMAGKIATCRLDRGDWQVLATTSSGGKEPCHLALDPSASWLACANYGDGTVAIFEIDPVTGMPALKASHPNHGRGPDTERQDGPHAHWVGFAGGRLYQTDLGVDQVRALPEGDGAPRLAWAAPPGTGPRHLAFHSQDATAYLINELASTVTALRVDDGQLIETQTLSTLPHGFAGESLGGHIAMNAAGDRLYVTNRGHDSVAVFARAADGALSLVQHIACGGASPRFFLLLEEIGEMLIGNEQGNAITMLRVDPDGGLRNGNVSLTVPAPAFIARLQAIGRK